ncbi:MAG: hypothetical protein PHG02_01995 [Oscillospiraceae bacterium]|nr:hypothetical protein [Oscillospiraceae bacterium]
MRWLHNELDILCKENKLRKAYVSQEGQDSITHMIEYVGELKLNLFELAILEKDLIGMALEAEHSGQSLASRIGDEKEFCDNLPHGNRKAQMGEMLFFHLKNALGAGAIIYAMLYCFNGFQAKMEFSVSYLVFVLCWWLFCSVSEVVINSVCWDKKRRSHLSFAVFAIILAIWLLLSWNTSNPYGVLGETCTFYTYGFLPMTILALIWVTMRLLFNAYIHKQAKGCNWQN